MDGFSLRWRVPPARSRKMAMSIDKPKTVIAILTSVATLLAIVFFIVPGANLPYRSVDW